MNNDAVYLRHILEAIDTIRTYLQGMTHASLEQNKMLRDAVVRELEIIGEATRNTSEDFKRAHPNIPFAKMIGMRNNLIHQYFDVDMDIVWETCIDDLPPLEEAIDKFLKEHTDSP